MGVLLLMLLLFLLLFGMCNQFSAPAMGKLYMQLPEADGPADVLTGNCNTSAAGSHMYSWPMAGALNWFDIPNNNNNNNNSMNSWTSIVDLPI